jgi:hypothetical protein
MPHRARLVRRDLAATAVPFARSIDGHLAHHGLQALTPLRLRRKGGITLSDGEGQGERAPSRRSARLLACGGAILRARRTGRSGSQPVANAHSYR